MRADVALNSAGLSLAGHLYTSDDLASGRHPAIVVGHPGSGVKEQAPAVYAQRLAHAGFVTLAFDSAYQGESEGMPRGLEDPAHRVEDLKAAVSFLSTHDDVDPDRIGILGICASGGYALTATASDHRVRAVATVSGVDIASQFRNGADGAQDPSVFQGMLDAAAAARTAETRGDGIGTFPIFPQTSEEARTMGGRHGFEGFEYYCTERAQHPRSAKSFTWSSVDRMATFDAFRFIDQIAPRPILLIAGSEAVTSWMSVEAFQKARGPKELVWIDGASHVDLYDRDQYVKPALNRLINFFTTNLNDRRIPTGELVGSNATGS
jgi:fermentation-respiration switch protein FrsA (DUF1100 family)